VITAVRRAVGDDYLLGVRQSAIDYNSRPVNFRWPPVWPLRHYFTGNGLEENLYYARELKALGVDYLHMTSGFGFVNPAENSGTYPLEEIRLFANSTRHLSFKAKVRAAILNTVPDFVLRPTLGFGWGYVAANNAAFARRFREETGLPVIANGGFQAQDLIEEHLTSGSCDLVSMARPLLANPDLLAAFQAGKNMPDKPCTHCGRCCVRTAVFPLGCYDLSRFDSAEAMEAQILAWSATIEEQIQ
jgi:2,4-dienoyl-CoA reductase (NADPH2)